MDFDKIIPRHGTDSLKYDGSVPRGKPEGLLPLWVADMDFAAPDEVLAAINERVAHGVFGYSEPDGAYFAALANWFGGRFGYDFKREWVALAPGVVYAIAVAVRALTKRGDAVLIQEPVYYPFRQTVLHNDRRLVVNELLLGRAGATDSPTVGASPSDAATAPPQTYTVDLEDFEAKIAANDVKLFILCSPHNPVGRCFSADELREMVRICAKHDVLIFSDEIHCDFIFGDKKHHLLPALCPDEAPRMILATAPSKTFNLAGLQLANIFISDEKLRRIFVQEIYKSGFSQANALGIVACRAAYAHGAAWLDALNTYLWENFMYLDNFLKTNLPTIQLTPPQATYLAWLDCRALGLSPDELDYKLIHEAGLWLSRGDSFGQGGAGFTRINVGCPRATLVSCMERFANAVSK